MATEVRKSTALSLTINFPNDVMPQPFRRPVLTTYEQVLIDGQQAEQPQHMQRPILQSEVTDEMLAALNVQLALVGLSVARVETANA